MDQYFPVVSKATSSRNHTQEKDKRRSATRYQPYGQKQSDHNPTPNTRNSELRKLRNELKQNGVKPSNSATTKFLLATLSDESNPITHSDSGDRADRVISTATGHQVSEGMRDRRSYFEDRDCKLAIQRDVNPESREPQVLVNVRVYINGFLNNTTDIEMKRIIIQAGGQVVATPSGCTHILTSMQLSGTKTHKFLTTKSRNKFHVVRPEWVTDSIEARKRQPERKYAIIKNCSTRTLHDMLQKQGGGFSELNEFR